jgi:DNA polymerase III subunit beta
MQQTMSISSFSKRVGISISALRFYDQCGVLVPAQVDGSTGYRSYAATQAADAELLRDLRRLDLSIEQIKQFQQSSAEERAALVAERVAGFGALLQEINATARSLRTRIHNDGEAVPAVQVEATTLGSAIDQVVSAASTDPKLPELQRVLFEAREGSLRLVATDRHRLAIRDLQPHQASDGVFRALVRADDVASLRAALPAVGLASVEHLGEQLVIRTDNGDHELAVSLTDFPPYERMLIAAPEGRRLVTDKAALLSALGPVLQEEYVVLTFTEDALLLDGEDGVSLPATFDGIPLTLAVNPAYLHDGVRHSIGPEVLIEVTDAVHPVVLRSADDGSYTCMVMPVRVGKQSEPRARKAPVR